MINSKVLQALNDQIQKEFASSYLYLAMAAQLENDNLPGFAKWMQAQAQEEWGHGMKIFAHINDRGARVTLQAIEKPKDQYGNPLDIFKAVLDHERKVTASIHQLYELAIAEKDYPAQTFLTWFINEQVEEEKTAEEIVAQLEAVEQHKHAILIMDRHLAQRAG
jgi:ferritin